MDCHSARLRAHSADRAPGAQAHRFGNAGRLPRVHPARAQRAISAVARRERPECARGAQSGYFRKVSSLTKFLFPIELRTLCRGGGIGRRTWFRSMRWRHCGGSSPFRGTKHLKLTFYVSFQKVTTPRPRSGNPGWISTCGSIESAPNCGRYRVRPRKFCANLTLPADAGAQLSASGTDSLGLHEPTERTNPRWYRSQLKRALRRGRCRRLNVHHWRFLALL